MVLMVGIFHLIFHSAAPPTPITTTAAPAQTHSAPDMQTTPAPTTVNASTSSPAHNVSTTSSPIKSAPTTVGVGVAGVGEKETPPQTAADEATPNATVAVSVEASARHGMSSGSLAAVVVVAVLLVIGVLLAVILFVVCRRYDSNEEVDLSLCSERSSSSYFLTQEKYQFA